MATARRQGFERPELRTDGLRELSAGALPVVVPSEHVITRPNHRVFEGHEREIACKL